MLQNKPQITQRELDRQKMVINEKCKAQSAFFFGVSIAILASGIIGHLVKQSPAIDFPLFIVTCMLATIFYIIGNNRLDQMVG